jgi:hypothetical protein
MKERKERKGSRWCVGKGWSWSDDWVKRLEAGWEVKG